MARTSPNLTTRCKAPLPAWSLNHGDVLFERFVVVFELREHHVAQLVGLALEFSALFHLSIERRLLCGDGIVGRWFGRTRGSTRCHFRAIDHSVIDSMNF